MSPVLYCSFCRFVLWGLAAMGRSTATGVCLVCSSVAGSCKGSKRLLLALAVQQRGTVHMLLVVFHSLCTLQVGWSSCAGLLGLACVALLLVCLVAARRWPGHQSLPSSLVDRVVMVPFDTDSKQVASVTDYSYNIA